MKWLKDKNYLRCIETLKDSPVFDDVCPIVVRNIIHDMKYKKWVEGTFKDCDEISHNTMYFILSGKVKIYQVNQQNMRNHTIFILCKGDVFDILSLFDDEPHCVFWEVLEDLELLKLTKEKFNHWLHLNTTFHDNVFKYIGDKIRNLERRNTEFTLCNTLVRLCKVLLLNINQGTEKLEVINNLPNSEIASLIGTTRAVVNRHIQELKKSGAVSVSRNKIKIKNVQKLIDIAEENNIV